MMPSVSPQNALIDRLDRCDHHIPRGGTDPQFGWTSIGVAVGGDSGHGTLFASAEPIDKLLRVAADCSRDA